MLASSSSSSLLQMNSRMRTTFTKFSMILTSLLEARSLLRLGRDSMASGRISCVYLHGNSGYRIYSNTTYDPI